MKTLEDIMTRAPISWAGYRPPPKKKKKKDLGVGRGSVETPMAGSYYMQDKYIAGEITEEEFDDFLANDMSLFQQKLDHRTELQNEARAKTDFSRMKKMGGLMDEIEAPRRPEDRTMDSWQEPEWGPVIESEQGRKRKGNSKDMWNRAGLLRSLMS